MRWGENLLQTGDWRPTTIGALTGVTAAVAVWQAATHRINLDGQTLILVALGLFIAGVVLLLLRKEGLPPRRALFLETLGACLAAPLMVGFAVFGLLFWLPSPDAFRKPQS